MSTTATRWSRSRSSSATRARSTLVSSAGPRCSSTNCSARMLIIDVLHVRVEFVTIVLDDPVSSGRFGDVERIIGRLHQLLPRVNAGMLVARDSYANRTAERAPMVFELMLLYLLTHPIGESHRRVGDGAWEKDHEFLSAVTPDPIDLAHVMLQELRELGEHHIARLVPVRIVDALEVIDVEHRERELFVEARRVLEHFVENFVEMAPIEDARERIGNRQLLEL